MRVVVPGGSFYEKLTQNYVQTRTCDLVVTRMDSVQPTCICSGLSAGQAIHYRRPERS